MLKDGSATRVEQRERVVAVVLAAPALVFRAARVFAVDGAFRFAVRVAALVAAALVVDV